ncbi:MAG: calcineurin-like phosphoesterase C-terminal domain-containing protein [Bacteroidales bacterium]|nr:calcineurin-like phosphoesterase C-terminal domain-containing protein [Bacteroidales bacterium]
MGRFYFIALAALLLASCEREVATDVPVAPAGKAVSITAEIPSSKTALGPKDNDFYPNYWADGDAISVNGVSSSPLSEVPAGTARATFQLAGVESPYYAAYPASAVSGYASGGATVSIPAEQNWVSGSYDPAAFIMLGTSEGGVIGFVPQVAILKITLTGDASIVSVSLTSPGGLPLAGGFTTDFSSLAASGENVSTVTVRCPGGAPAGSSWYVVIPPSDFTVDGIRIVITDAAGGTMTRTAVPSKAYVAGKLYSTSLPYSPDPVGGIADAAALRAFLQAPSGDAFLTADIDLQGESVSAASFDGVFDGRGHTISNPGAPLFASNSGTLKDFTVEGAFEPSGDVFSPVVLRNEGNIDGVVNRASVSMSRTSASSSSVVIGGIAAYSSGPISSCTNEGSISFVSSSSVKGVGIGGIAGYQTAALTSCVNSGKLTFSAHHPAGSSAIGGISNALVSLGGIAGYGYTGFSATGCTNSGELHFDYTGIESVTADSERHQIGGIAGSPCGEVRSCVNDGGIFIGAVTSDRSASSKCVLLDIGGICGGEYFSPGQNVTSIVSCTNNGAITADFDATDGNTTVGGIVGWPNLESSVNNRTEDCVNTGTITAYGKGKGRFGGIQAGTGRILNCRNEGDIIIESTASTSSAGGVCAFHALGHTLSGSSNTGNISTKVVIEGQGGLIGVVSNYAMTVGESCSVSCILSSVAGDNKYIGMVAGCYNGTSKKNTLGTTAQPISVEGSVSLAGAEVLITAANYGSWLAGTYNSTPNHTINAVCNTTAQAVTVEGHVRWSDGTPAAGVSVSNGFDVVVTDSQGYYTLPDNDDVWYYYISMPADAVISKNADGCPDFYKRKLAGCTSYDFTLERQAVEDRFVLFAMADPQAHNVKRENQTLVNSDRFRDESVPAINACAAGYSLPCYGVTLGDIVYNEDNRNSTGGLPTMRSIFSGINMPVFQTIGNHDYTWFYTSSGNELKTDATSSTLFLKAQRAFEDCFGPINFSFNRGDVHIVCMRNIIWTNSTEPRKYRGGFTDEQYEWLAADLANVPSDKTVIFCVHIPISSCPSGDNVSKVMTLLKGFSHAEIFSAHTHYIMNVPDVGGSGIYEHVHEALCGIFWWSNLAVDGAPNGYHVYEFSGKQIVDSYFIGVNNHMNTRDYQMRIYRGGVKYGGSYIYFQNPHPSDVLLINVFNSDANWKVEVYENDVLAGEASLMPEKKETYSDAMYSTVTYGLQSSQDWWAQAYHLGVLGKGFKNGALQSSNGDYMDHCYHMYKYTMKNPSASVKVVATDTFGHSYTCTEVVEQDCWYPDYMRLGNN